MRLVPSLSVAYLTSRKRQAVISILGVTFGVAFFIALFSMLKGLQEYFIQQVIDVSPHIVMRDEFRQAPEQPITGLYPSVPVEIRGLKPKEEIRGIRHADQISKYLQKKPGFHVSPVLVGQSFLRYGGKDVPTRLNGVDPLLEKEASTIEKNLLSGSFDNLLTESNGIIIGKGLADKLGARTGARLSVVSSVGSILSMKVVGIFRTGITSLDQNESFALLKKVQILEKKENTINEIRIRLNKVDDAEKYAAEIENVFDYRTESWQEINSGIFGVFVIQKIVMYSTITVILLVAGFGIYNIISTIVNEKVKDIAILLSLGFSRKDIAGIFVYQGIIVGIIGVLLGWLLGAILTELLAAYPINLEGSQLFIQTRGLIMYRSLWQYVISALFAFSSTILASYLPAQKAASLNPVDIIRGTG